MQGPRPIDTPPTNSVGSFCLLAISSVIVISVPSGATTTSVFTSVVSCLTSVSISNSVSCFTGTNSSPSINCFLTSVSSNSSKGVSAVVLPR